MFHIPDTVPLRQDGNSFPNDVPGRHRYTNGGWVAGGTDGLHRRRKGFAYHTNGLLHPKVSDVQKHINFVITFPILNNSNIRKCD